MNKIDWSWTATVAKTTRKHNQNERYLELACRWGLGWISHAFESKWVILGFVIEKFGTANSQIGSRFKNEGGND